MIRDFIRLSLSMLLILLSLPFFAISFLIAAPCAAVAALFPSFHRQRQVRDIDSGRLRAVGEFEFGRALDSYEDLISAHAGTRR